MISTPEPLKNQHSAHTANMVAQSQQNDLQVGTQGNPESIKNRQKSRSGLQGVRLGVPSDPGSANCHQNDDPRPQKWRPQASKMPGLSFQLTSSHRSTNQQWGGRRQGAKPLRIRRARPWPAVGVGRQPPRKVPTFPEGNPGVFACAADPPQSVQKSCFF